MVYFSDNITTIELTDSVTRFIQSKSSPGCALIGREVEDPERFGVAIFDEQHNIVDIIEKPENQHHPLLLGGSTYMMNHFGKGWIKSISCLAINYQFLM